MTFKSKTTNTLLKALVQELKKTSIVEEASIWKRIASDLEKSNRNRRVVNLSRLNRFTKANETVIVPGKVLGSGIISHSVTVAAFSFSDSAIEQLKQNKCTVVSIEDLMKKNPKGKDIRIIG
ncbi:50S ribosomal protein L18e [Candidatus Woesearchaeota archaeon]|jgi:large subunit ribosomal protein L18e|nr:50S ribosomal protein L18e [Candidatus Woesearchaeota archaeon]MBT6519392.1 50S ribosomal protein L18e [Candidatus Woesearchaeota archaeon]MBT7366852.1 50S ribosomal protein L18e [Candidatus Woesearchaeota archaeon]